MPKTRLVMKDGALYKLRREPGVRRDLEKRGEAILDAVGGHRAGYMLNSTQGAKRPQGRWAVRVFTANIAAMVDNRRNQTLVRAFGVARRG